MEKFNAKNKDGSGFKDGEDSQSKRIPNGGLTASARSTVKDRSTKDTTSLSNVDIASKYLSSDLDSQQVSDNTEEMKSPPKAPAAMQAHSSIASQISNAQPKLEANFIQKSGDVTDGKNSSASNYHATQDAKPVITSIAEHSLNQPSAPAKQAKKSSISSFKSKNFAPPPPEPSPPVSPSSRSPAKPVKSSGSRIPNGLLELEKIALDLEEEDEDDSDFDSELLDIEVSEGSLAWSLAKNSDNEDYDSDNSYGDDDDEENEDEFGRTRGSFFPWLPRGINTPVRYSNSPLRGSESSVPEDISSSFSGLKAVDGAALETEANLEPEDSSQSESSKQVRFLESVAVQKFYSKSPSSTVEIKESNKLSSVTLKPGVDDEAVLNTKKMSRFKISRQKSAAGRQAGTGNFFSALNTTEADDAAGSPPLTSDPKPVDPKPVGKVFGDVIERDYSAAAAPPILKPSVVPKKSAVTSLPPIDSTKNLARRKTSNRPKPTTISRPVPKKIVVPPLVHENIDVEKLLRENVIPNFNAKEVREAMEADEEDEVSEQPLLSETILERHYEPPEKPTRKSKQSLFKKMVQEKSAEVNVGRAILTEEVPENQAKESDLDENDDLDPDIHRQEISVAYHRLRQKMIDKQNGYHVKPEEREFVPLDENGEVLKVSRFMSARLADRAS
ncbi:uncharacterized protein V2V93DRAFT_149552 [Kockiozyma suomiensis]|uniref:uncharacterized protein n=1 Tax=Kockiozyma suomiensis TaxID=1337062 RepID=UPI003343A6B3